MEHPINDLLNTTMTKIREMIDVNTIIGDPISTADGITIIPVSSVSFGFASGGIDFQSKNQAPSSNNNFGGGGGAGVKITPIAFMVIKGESVRLIPVSAPANTTVERVIDMVPEVLERFTEAFGKKENKDDPFAD